MPDLVPDMLDNRGHKVMTWLPHMQSEAFLRQCISKGIRTDECWAELSERQQRVYSAMQAIHGADWRPEHKPAK